MPSSPASTPYSRMPQSHRLKPKVITVAVEKIDRSDITPFVVLYTLPLSVSKWVSGWAEFRTSVASRLASLFSSRHDWALANNLLKLMQMAESNLKIDFHIFKRNSSTIDWKLCHCPVQAFATRGCLSKNSVLLLVWYLLVLASQLVLAETRDARYCLSIAALYTPLPLSCLRLYPFCAHTRVTITFHMLLSHIWSISV